MSNLEKTIDFAGKMATMLKAASQDNRCEIVREAYEDSELDDNECVGICDSVLLEIGVYLEKKNETHFDFGKLVVMRTKEIAKWIKRKTNDECVCKCGVLLFNTGDDTGLNRLVKHIEDVHLK